MMEATTQLLTADDLLQMQNDVRCELIRGELVTMLPTEITHGRTSAVISASLYSYVSSHNLGAVYAAETGFIIATNPDTVRAPDVAFVRQERIDAVGDVEGYWPGPPDLAVEVISPNDRYTEVEEKVVGWLEAGTAMVIVVNPKKRVVTVYRSLDDIAILTEGEVLRGEPVVSGWEMAVADMFS